MLIICKGIKLSTTSVGSKNAIVPHLKSVRHWGMLCHNILSNTKTLLKIPCLAL